MGPFHTGAALSLLLGELLTGRDAGASRRRERVFQINPLTGKQPIGNPKSNRKALLLEKAMRRRQSQEPTQ